MIAIIDYDAGNTRSVINVLKRLNADFTLTDDHEAIKTADKIILPGVGHAAAAMDKLKKKELLSILKSCQKPFLGICVGMQLMYEFSDEGNTDCMGIVKGRIKAFVPQPGIKVPHMGWNTNTVYNPHNADLFRGLEVAETYFVHSYYAEVNENTSTTCDYSLPFASAVQKDNFFGVQFHPEKSGLLGQIFINNFLQL
jgi:glutamine amidotransferase